LYHLIVSLIVSLIFSPIVLRMDLQLLQCSQWRGARRPPARLHSKCYLRITLLTSTPGSNLAEVRAVGGVRRVKVRDLVLRVELVLRVLLVSFHLLRLASLATTSPATFYGSLRSPPATNPQR
jgi:hypothetical protein